MRGEKNLKEGAKIAGLRPKYMHYSIITRNRKGGNNRVRMELRKLINR